MISDTGLDDELYVPSIHRGHIALVAASPSHAFPRTFEGAKLRGRDTASRKAWAHWQSGGRMVSIPKLEPQSDNSHSPANLLRDGRDWRGLPGVVESTEAFLLVTPDAEAESP